MTLSRKVRVCITSLLSKLRGLCGWGTTNILKARVGGMNMRRQWLPGTAGLMPNWTYRDCDSMHGTCPSSTKTKPQHREEGGTKSHTNEETTCNLYSTGEVHLFSLMEGHQLYQAHPREGPCLWIVVLLGFSRGTELIEWIYTTRGFFLEWLTGSGTLSPIMPVS